MKKNVGDHRCAVQSLVMKVALDCHVPFFLAHGGMQIQVEQTLRSLREIGVEATPLPWWEESFSPQIIHFFGKPSLSYAGWARQKKIRLVVADLLTAQGSRNFLQRVPFQILCFLDRFCGGKIRQRLGWAVYDAADCCVCLTPWEASLIRDMYGARRARLEVVPNGVEEVFMRAGPASSRADHLVTTVTITQRKRVLELVEAAALAQVKVRIIGKPYQESDPYYLQFLDGVKKAQPWVDYRGPITDRSQLCHEYRMAKGFVLLSAMESQSLSALEAAACGCPLLLTDLPWARVSFGEQASYCPLTGPRQTAPYLRKFLDNASAAPVPQGVLSWRQVAQRLTSLYQELLASKVRV